MSDRFVPVGVMRLRLALMELRAGRVAALDRDNMQNRT